MSGIVSILIKTKKGKHAGHIKYAITTQLKGDKCRLTAHNKCFVQ